LNYPILKKIIVAFIAIAFFASCENAKKERKKKEQAVVEKVPDVIQYGYNLNEFDVVRDTIRKGETFGGILSTYNVTQDKIYEVATKFRDSFDVRKIVIGKPYVLLNSKDSINRSTQVFIYETNKVDYAVVDFRNTVNCYNNQKPVKYVEKIASGVITSSLSATMEEQNLSPYMTDKLSNIYAWTVNFFKLQVGDRFKVVYTERFIDDTIPAGLKDINAAYFEHNGKQLYAFNYLPDSIPDINGYYDENGDNLKRAFLKAPVKFSRISSRYNLKRRIKYYGFKLRPHRGTDFAAPIGTPILATADGVVTRSERKGGNGNYVKIRHNGTYETQYLHMRSRNVRVGQNVNQGDVIGWIGMTGNTGGPHVCYRYWKNGKQVDPFQDDAPVSEPLPKKYLDQYYAFALPEKDKLDCIEYN